MKIEKDQLIEQAAQKEKAILKGTLSTSFDSVVKNKEDEFKKGFRTKEAGYNKPEGASALDEVEQEFSDKMDVALRKNQMAVLSNTTSAEDFQKLQEEGFPAHDTDTRTMVTVTDKIKTQLVKAGVDVSYMGDELNQDQLESIGGSVSAAVQLAQKMQEADIPVTNENLEEGIEAMNQAEELTSPNEGAVKYMIDNHLTPTVENLYTAQHCGSESYMGAEEQQIDFEALKGQMEQVITEAGYIPDEKSIADSAWMIENEIPFTPQNFAYMQQLEGLTLPMAQNDMAAAIVLAISEGQRPKDAVVIPEYSLTSQAEKAVAVVSEATDNDLAYLVSSGREITIENLKQAIEERQSGRALAGQTADSILNNSAALEIEDAAVLTNGENFLSNSTSGQATAATTQQLALLAAKRQLEETRLAMTTEANLALLKRGIAIDTKPLEELVAQLKSQEKNYYAAILGETSAADGVSAGLYEETNRKVADLKTVPAYVLGSKGKDLNTVNGLHEAGAALKDTFEKANQSYENLMTSPRKDLGDSIQKAFANVDDILEDIGLEKNDANQRAVRILAYNSLDINDDSIREMKAADEKVQRTFSNLTPATVKELIAQGINPLDMNLDELNQKAEQIRNQSGETEEKFSEYLWKLEQNQEISQEERESYVGIYRLMNQIEKTDGAAIGALVSQGADLTMRNLLTAVRNAKKSGMDYTVNDDFKGVDSVKGSTKSITDQIDAAYQQNCMKDILESMTPVAFQKLLENPSWEDATPEQMKEEIEKAMVSQAEKEDAQSREYARTQLQDFSTAAASDQEVYSLLSKYQLPNTVNHVLAASRLLHQRNSVFSKLFNSDEDFSGDKVDFKEIQQGILEKFSDALESPESLAEAEKALADTAENVMKTMIADDEHITSMDIREMKLMCTQLSIAGKMAEEENYTIPVIVGDEVTNLSLKIVRGKEKKGFVDIMFESRFTGKVAASFEAKEKGISGMAATDNERTKEILEKSAEKMIEQMIDESSEEIQFSAVFAEKLDLEQYGKNAEKSHTADEEKSSDTAVQTSRLYGIAKSFIETVKELAKSTDI